MNGKKYVDSESEEHSPTAQELGVENALRRDAEWELFDIKYELSHPQEDRYTGEKNRFGAVDPEMFYDRLVYLRIDYIEKIKDPELRKKLEDRVSKVEERVYRQFIPFIDSLINVFGWQNSPLEEIISRHKMDPDQLSHHFERARAATAHVQISEEEWVDFLAELDLLQRKFDDYQNEPTLFTFEKVEQELYKEIVGQLDKYWEITKSAKALDDSIARRESILGFDLWLAKAHSLKEMAKRMLVADIKYSCQGRADAIFDYVKYLKERSEAPRELLAIEAELRDLFKRAKDGEAANQKKLGEIRVMLNELKGKKLGLDFVKTVNELTRLCEKVSRIYSGMAEDIEDDDERFQHVYEGVDWAWDLLGVDPDASEGDVTKAYRRLSLKYHPDVSKDKNSEEKMKKISEAVSLIRRVRGRRK